MSVILIWMYSKKKLLALKCLPVLLKIYMIYNLHKMNINNITYFPTYTFHELN